MSYVVATSFNLESWDKYGLNWLRQAKSCSLNGYIIGVDISEQAIKKIQELEFVYLPMEEKHRVRGDVFTTLAKNLPREKRCLWTNPYILPKPNIETKADLLCGTEDVSAESLTVSVYNLYDRAAMIESLNEKIKSEHKAFLSSEYMLGTYDFWNGFSSCQNYLYDKEYLDTTIFADDLILNFFVAFANSLSVEIRKYPE
jgi:hypothetical protein